jgi:hypothetical protein
VWLYENTSLKIEGVIVVSQLRPLFAYMITNRNIVQGFDEYMNIVIDDAEEINTKSLTKKDIGKSLIPIGII